MKGIDVSSWNEEIDWAKLKEAGVEFAIVRIFHHIKNTPNYELDEQFERNVKEAQKYGIQLGGYFFSYAQNLSAIETEAKMVVDELKKYPGVFTFPIAFDAEDGDTTDDPDVEGNDVYDIGSFAGDASKKFCDILAENGYYPMVYSYTWYFENKIGMSKVKDYDLWLASYPKSNGTQIYAGDGPGDTVDHTKREKLSSYDSNVTMWQYTGAGKIDGIYAGDGGAIVDLNVCYYDYPSIIKNGGYNGFEKPAFTTKPLVYRTGANGAAATYKASRYYTHVTSIGLTGDGVTDTLACALSQLGYYEGTSSNPYGGLYNTNTEYTTNKTTEYVYNYGDADSSGYKMAWCASFCSWAIYQSQTANHATHDQSCRNNIGKEGYIWRECSCYQWADQLKRFNLYSARGSYTPKTGDLIFFKMEGGGSSWTNHIGLVLYCDGTKVYTVEGNRKNHVGLYNYALTDTQICGYGKLPYPTNPNAPKVDYTGKNKTQGQYITDNATLAVSKTKGGSADFTVGKYEMFDVTGFEDGYAVVSYKGSTGYATLNSTTIQVTATSSEYRGSGMNASVDASSVKTTSYAGGTKIPAENNNANNPNILITGLREDTKSYKGLENFGSNNEKIMINGRTLEKWESRPGSKIINSIWIYGDEDGKAYLGIDIADTSRLRVKGADGTGEEIETIVIGRGFEIVKADSELWSGDEISTGTVIGTFKENVILVANENGGFDVTFGGSNELGLEGYTFETTNAQLVKLTADANVRLGPGTENASIGVGLAGDTFEYLDEIKNDKWLKVDYNGQVGWISNVNAQVVTVPSYVDLTADANVRSGPGTENSVLGVGLAGDSFEYLNEIQNTKWLKVNYNGQTGWISNVNATVRETDTVVKVTAANSDWNENSDSGNGNGDGTGEGDGDGSGNGEGTGDGTGTGTGTGTGGGFGGGGGGGGGGSSSKPKDDKTEEEEPTDQPVDTPETAERKFTDLGNHKWAEDAIYRLVEAGVVNGTSENTYSPGVNITRADFTTLIVRAFKFEAEVARFVDVEAAKYYAEPIGIAKTLGIVNGVTATSFAPNAPITRQDMMVIIYRALKVAAPDKLIDPGLVDTTALSKTYRDYSLVSEYAKEAVSVLAHMHYVNGSNGMINHKANTTRAEVAVVLDRILNQ